jgi:hypothetical protein
MDSMVSANYLQAQHLVEQLTLRDQARLLEYLSFRLVQVVSARMAEPLPTDTTPANAWQKFFQVGDNMMHADRPDSETLTAAVLAMRR